MAADTSDSGAEVPSGGWPALPSTVPYERLGREQAMELKWRLCDATLALLAGLASADAAERSAVAEACGPDGAADGARGTVAPIQPIAGGVSLASAALSNTYFLRRSDWGDTHLPPVGMWGHPSDQMGALLALVQLGPTPGRQVVELVDLAYRTWSAACLWVPALRGSGWDYTTVLSVTLPVLAGRCVGQDDAAIRNAMWLSGAGGAVVGAVREPPVTRWKSGASAYAAARALWCWRLARFFGGREAMLRSQRGLAHLLGAGGGAGHPGGDRGAAAGAAEGPGPAHGARQLDALPGATPGTDQPASPEAHIYAELVLKEFPCFQLAQGPVTCALALREQLAGRLDRVERVTVAEPGLREHSAIARGAMPYPDDPSAADHSLGYCVASALHAGRVTPFEFTPEAIDDPAKRRLFDLVHVRRDLGDAPEHGADEVCRVEVELRGGSRLSHTAPAALHRTAAAAASASARLEAVQATVQRKRRTLEAASGWNLDPLVDAIERLEDIDGRDLHAALRACVGG